MPLQKLFVVVGATGVGKTKLGIDLAKALNGEVVNADAMQMYKGLDIASAKATKEEMDGVPHHIIDFLEPSAKFTVRAFRDMALPIIEDITNRGKTPIVVGGTLYYIQSLLWPSLIDDTPEVSMDKSKAIVEPAESTDELYRRLLTLDPDTAERVHPLDRRKIIRNLSIFQETGSTASELIDKQKDANLTDQLRFHCSILWLTCSPEVYQVRLASRIQKMIEKGLWEEAESFIKEHKMYMSSSSEVSERSESGLSSEEGIFQAIGYREFLPLYDAKLKDDITTERQNALMEECKEALKIKHRQYARKQLKWIKSRILTRNAPTYELDTTNFDTDPLSWEREVKQPAIEICNFFSSSDSLLNDPPGKTRVNKDQSSITPNKLKRFVCEICNMTIIGEKQWGLHSKSRKHRQNVNWIAKKESAAQKSSEIDEWKEFVMEETEKHDENEVERESDDHGRCDVIPAAKRAKNEKHGPKV